MTIPDLTPDERDLFVELGYHIARVMWQTLGQSDPTFQTLMWDRAESVYEHGCLIMLELGVFALEDTSQYRFAMPLDEVRAHLRGLTPETRYGFDQIIGNFLWATAEYQGDVSTGKDPFEVPGFLHPAMWGFVKLGYATRAPGGFRWTDRIAPIMIAEYLWSGEGESFDTLERQEADALAEAMWAALPLWRRHLLARRIMGKDAFDIQLYLFRRWDGTRFSLGESRKKKWRTLPQGYQKATQEIARRLVALRRSHPF